MITLILYINIAILVYFFSLSIWYTLILFTAFPDLIKEYKQTEYGHLDQLMQHCTIPLSIIIPAFNEKMRIINSIYSILQSTYTNVNIIVVNDGSTDDTLNILINEFSLYEVPPVIRQSIPTQPIRQYYQSSRYKNLVVLDKLHSPTNNGADSDNAGLNAAVTPIVMTLDADTILEPTALEQMVYCYLSHKQCIAVGGAIYVLNGNKVEHGRVLTREISNQFIPALQAIEYLRSFTYGRAGLNYLSGALCYPGAFTLFETKAAKEFGGFNAKNYSYDAEIIIQFHQRLRQKKYPTHVRFSSTAVAWTNVPHSLSSYWEQRNRWQRGMLLSVFNHKSMFLNPKYGIVGLCTFPAFVLYEVFGPVIEFISYSLLAISLCLGIVSWATIGWYFLLAWCTLTLLTIATFCLSLSTLNIFKKPSDIIRSIWLISLEMFGFRQFKAACGFYGTIQFLFNRIRGKNL